MEGKLTHSVEYVLVSDLVEISRETGLSIESLEVATKCAVKLSATFRAYNVAVNYRRSGRTPQAVERQLEHFANNLVEALSLVGYSNSSSDRARPKFSLDPNKMSEMARRLDYPTDYFTSVWNAVLPIAIRAGRVLPTTNESPREDWPKKRLFQRIRLSFQELHPGVSFSKIVREIDTEEAHGGKFVSGGPAVDWTRLLLKVAAAKPGTEAAVAELAIWDTETPNGVPRLVEKAGRSHLHSKGATNR